MPSVAILQDTRVQPDVVLRKLNLHIMVKFCLLVRHHVYITLPVRHVPCCWIVRIHGWQMLTVFCLMAQTLLNHMDRANLVGCPPAVCTMTLHG